MATQTQVFNAVFLGLAEVRIPLRLLPPDEQPKVADLAYCAITDMHRDEDQKREIDRVIGCIDAQYALQEVTLKVADMTCLLIRGEEVILRHKIRDVIFGKEIVENSGKFIYITRSENFGRAAVLLMVRKQEMVTQILTVFKIACDDKKNNKGSFGRKFSFLKPYNKGLIKPQNSQPLTSDESTDDEDPVENELKKEIIVLKSEPLKIDIPNVGTITPIQAEIMYLLDMESNYLNSLIDIENCRDEIVKIAPRELVQLSAFLFNKVKELTWLHTRLLNYLKGCNDDIPELCRAFLQFDEEYENYIFFIENIPKVDNILQNYSIFFRATMPQLIDNLRKPRMKLNHYILILESILKKTPEAHKELVNKAIVMFKSHLQCANKVLLLKSIDGCPFDLNTKGNIIIDSDLHLIKAIDIPKKLYHVILLEKELVIARGTIDKYQFVTSFRTSEINVIEIIRGLCFTIHVYANFKSQLLKYVFKAKNVTLQQQWRDALEEITADRAASLDRNSNERNSRRKFKSGFSDSEDETALRPGQSSPWARRRGIRKKSVGYVGSPLSRNSSLSDADFIPSRKYIFEEHNLTIWTLFPSLQVIYRASYQDYEKDLKTPTNTNFNKSLLKTEQQYIECLIGKLGQYLEEDMLKPPREINTHFKKLYEFHNEKMIIVLSKEHNISKSRLAVAINLNAKEFIEIYSNYFVDRIMLHNEMSNLDANNPFIEPFNHFEYYFETLFEHVSIISDSSGSIKSAISVLQETVTLSNNKLVNLNVDEIPFSLDNHGPIIQCDRIRVKCRSRTQEMQVLLFEEIIVLLDLRVANLVFSESLRLDCIGLSPGNHELTFQLQFNLNTGSKRVYHFRFVNNSTKKNWWSAITCILNKQYKQIKKEITKKLSTSLSFDLESIENTGLLQTDL